MAALRGDFKITGDPLRGYGMEIVARELDLSSLENTTNLGKQPHLPLWTARSIIARR